MATKSERVLAKLQKTNSPYEQGFSKALNDNPNFEKYINGLGSLKLYSLSNKIETYTTPEDKQAFHDMLKDTASDINYDTSKFDIKNLDATIQSYKNAQTTVAAPVAPVVAPVAVTTPPVAPDALDILAPVFALSPELEQAFENALDNNDKFYNKMTGSTNPNSSGIKMATTLADKLVLTDSNDPNHKFLDTQISEPLIGILNTVSNDPNYDITLLDKLGDAMQTHAEKLDELTKTRKTFKDENDAGGMTLARQQVLQKEIADLAEEENTAKMDLVDNVRAAGGVTNPLAKMDADIMLTFMGDLFGKGGGVDTALDNLTGSLGLSDAQAEAIRHQLEPILNLLRPMLKNYSQLYQKYETPTKEWINHAISDTKVGAGQQQTASHTTGMTLSDDMNETSVFNQVAKGIKADLTNSSTFNPQEELVVGRISDRFSHELGAAWVKAATNTDVGNNGELITKQEIQQIEGTLSKEFQDIVNNVPGLSEEQRDDLTKAANDKIHEIKLSI